jgi:transcriptional regulator with XRE-family HTH domain
MSLPQLAELVITSKQQVHKYESGGNRIGASRLFDLSRALDVPISFFFDDMPDSITADSGGAPGYRSQRKSFADDEFGRRETAELIRAYCRISDPSVRQRVRDLIISLGPAEAESLFVVRQAKLARSSR